MAHSSEQACTNLLLPSGQALLFDEEKISSREDLNLALTDLEDFLSTRNDEVNMMCSVLSSQESLNVSQTGKAGDCWQAH